MTHDPDRHEMLPQSMFHQRARIVSCDVEQGVGRVRLTATLTATLEFCDATSLAEARRQLEAAGVVAMIEATKLDDVLDVLGLTEVTDDVRS